MKIYTLTGDDGSTSLSGGKRVPKHSLRVEAYGSVDELIAWIGLLRGMDELFPHKSQLIYIQDQLMRCAAGLSNDGSNINSKVVLPEEDSLLTLENEIDKMEKDLPRIRNFILPGGKASVSNCHIARCVCRRAERAVSRLNEEEEIPRIIIKFLNRLSDFLFVLARLISYKSDNEEIIWSVR